MKTFLFFIFVLALLFTFGNEGWLRYYRLRQVEGGLEDEIHNLQKGNQLLQKEILDLKDPQQIEHLLREQMGYLRNNETFYEFVEKQ